MEAISLSNALFSKVQQPVLALIFGQPDRSFYTSEIIRNVQSGTGADGAAHRLALAGIVAKQRNDAICQSRPFLIRTRTCRSASVRHKSILHAPALHCHSFNQSKDYILDKQANKNDRE